MPQASNALPHAILLPAFALALAAFPFSGCKSPAAPEPQAASTNPPQVTIGGLPSQTISRAQSGDNLQFLSETLAPGRGMNTLQITAYLPGKGVIPLLATPALPEAASVLNADDARGNKSFSFGGAFLAPFANRITQVLSADKKTVTPEWQDGGQTRKVTLVPNWKGKLSGAIEHAMHGLILALPAQNVQNQKTPAGGIVSADIPAGDFGGHWFSKSDLHITSELTGNAITQTITITNAGDQPEPIGIAWHPYFAIPSGDRAQVRLHIPSETRAEVNNYDDVFVTGKLLPVKGTPYDFNAPNGAPLGKQFYDDNWVNLKKAPDGSSVTEIIDPAANYGLRITALSPEVNAVQVYSPPDRPIVVLEPQFNWNDPFGKQWHGKDTHMVTVAPGKTVTWKVRLELFTPPA